MSKKSNKHKRKIYNIRILKLRLKKRKKRKKKKSKVRKIIVNNNQLKNKIVDWLDINNFKKKVRRKRNQQEIIIIVPKIFSFIKNPEDTIKTLKKIFYSGMNKNIKCINLDHSKCEELGLCASLLTVLILKELKKKRKNDISYKGNVPKTEDANKLFHISGIIKQLGIADLKSIDTKTLDIISNKNESEMAEKIVDFYQECLRTQNYVLSDAGENFFYKMIGEVFDNAQQYSGSYGTWHAQGYFDKPQNNEEYGKCRLVLMNFGHSIYDGLKLPDTTELTRKQLVKQTNKTKKLFNFDFTEEILWSLYALQKNVSKRREKSGKNSDRGKGTMDLIYSFTKIGDNKYKDKPIMSITTGNCHILFDGKYNLIEVQHKNGVKIPMIAFNKKNSLKQKPDKSNVFSLKNKFPGVVISMEFYLDRTYMQSILKQGGHNE